MGLQVASLVCENESVNLYYLCNYKPLSAGGDELSKSLLRFKSGLKPDLDAWAECMVSELKRLDLVPGLQILRALSNKELITDPNLKAPLDHLGSQIATQFKAHYSPHLVYKKCRTKKVAGLPREERKAVLDGAYVFDHQNLEGLSKGVLLLDDILTTGSTMREMVRAIRLVLPIVPLMIVTLAATDHHALLNSYIELSSPSFEWESTGGWTMLEEDATPYLGLQQLKQTILNDSW